MFIDFGEGMAFKGEREEISLSVPLVPVPETVEVMDGRGDMAAN